MQSSLDAQGPKFARHDGLQATLATYGDEIAGAVQQSRLYGLLTGVVPKRDHRDFGIEQIFLLDDVTNGIVVSVAVEDQDFDRLLPERPVEGIRPIYPVAVRSVARIA